MERFFIIFFVTFITVFGCSSTIRTQNMEMVAKDWCMVMRASQVVPVYPLTEDMQVGDIFLVRRTVDDQHKEYNEKGFLPMDNLIGRLEPTGFKKFYSDSFAPNETKLTLPKDWMIGEGASWDETPGVSFPTYSFSVRSGAGLNIAAPVQSVPIGLSLMGTDAGEGVITIKDARTYGIDTKSLLDDVHDWERENHEFLLAYASKEGRTNYIRVISRIFLASKVDVSIRISQSQGGSLSAGAPKPVDLLSIKQAKVEGDMEAATAENYGKSIDAFNESIGKSLGIAKKGGVETILPGGTVKVVAASSRAISMEETFKRPLVIGYLGFDMAVGPNGILGPPIPTHAVLNKQTSPSVPVSDTVQLISNSRLAQAYLIIEGQDKAGNGRAKMLKKALDELGSFLPQTYPVPIFSVKPSSKELTVQKPSGSQLRLDPPGLRSLTTYRSDLILSLEALEQTDESSEEKKEWLQPTRRTYEDLLILLRQHQIPLQEANEYASYF